MLVLSRKKDEAIVVSPYAVVTVADFHGRTASLNIQAKKDLLVLREELANGENQPPQSATDYGMLVLSRTVGQAILIGHNIRVAVVDVHNGQVRLGVDAPRDIAIYRREMLPEDWKPGQPFPERG